MIRELINFMNDLMSDIPNIMEWKSQPDKGLHVFIDIDSNGVWINKDLKRVKIMIISMEKIKISYYGRIV